MQKTARAIEHEITRITTRYMVAGDIDESAWRMMLSLYSGKLKVRDAARAAGRPLSSGARLVKRLEGKGLLKRHPHPRDARIVWVELTSKGRGHLESYVSVLEAACAS